MKKIGKITCLFFLSIISFFNSYSQAQLDKKISIVFSEVKLKKALKVIEKEAGVKFSYSKKLIPVEERISYSCNDKPLSSIFNDIFSSIAVEYQLVDDYIILKQTNEQGINQGIRPETKASSTFTINGHISEAETGEILIGATILVEGLNQGTITNPYGFYSLTLPEGEYNLVISFIGYQEIRQQIKLNKNLEINGFLNEDTALLPELLIVSDQSLAFLENIQMGYTEVKPAQISQMPALMGEKDVIRSLQSIPGIKLYADGSTMFHVRGGNRDQNLILLDEATLYNPAHVLGLFSTITTEATKDIKLYKGDLPIQHGGRLSSLVDIKTNDGNMKRFGFSGNLGLTSSKLAFEGPLKKDKSSFFIGGRFSNLNWFTRRVAKSNARIGFYDFNTKFNVLLNTNNRLFFTFYSGFDKFEDIGNSGIEWGNFAGSIRWNHIFNSKLFLNTTLYSSSYNYYLITNATRRDAWHSSISNLSLKTDFSYFINPENNLYFGLNYRFHHFNPGNYEPGSGIRPDIVPFVPKKNVNEISLYAGNEQLFYEKFSIKYGLRLNIWQNFGPTTEIIYNDQHQPIEVKDIQQGEFYNSYVELSPRLALTYSFSDVFSSKVFYNRTVQNIHLITNSISPFTNFEVWLPSSINIKPQKADQLGVGLFLKLPDKGYNLSGEVYYKWLSNQIDYKDHASMILNPLIEGELRIGSGRAYGGEITMRKETGMLTGWIGYAYSRSFLKVPGINENMEYPTFYDRPHEINMNFNIKTKSRWEFSLNWLYTTGASITTPSGFYYYNAHTVPIYDQRSNDRLPDYHRMDLSVNLHLGRREARFKHYLNFSIYNLYGQKNPVYVNFNKTLNSNSEPKVPGEYFPLPEISPTHTFIYNVIPSISYNFKL